jgi:hypothetical protein
MTANFDTEVLQWPGGTLIAFFLWLYATAPSFWSVSPGFQDAMPSWRTSFE